MYEKKHLNQTEASNDGMVVVQDLEVKLVNSQLLKMFGRGKREEMEGHRFANFVSPECRDFIDKIGRDRENGRYVPNRYEFKAIRRNGTSFIAEVSVSLIEFEGKIARRGIIKDIASEEKAKKARNKANKKLKQQLKSQIKELEAKIGDNEERNKALNILLKKKEADINILEDNILTNIKALIEPYMQKIKKTRLDDLQKTFLKILDSNLNEIISPFSRKMSIKEYNLTPREIQIANLIIQGLPSKKIGEIMKVSPRTVDAHRKNIRRKVGLNKKKANLRSYLLALH